MIIQIKIEKRHFVFLIVLVSVLFVIGVNAYNSGGPPYRVGHTDDEIQNVSAGKVLPGTFSGGISGNFVFPGYITLGGVSRKNWTRETFSLPAANITAGTFGAYVGNGNFAFPAALTVPGVLGLGNYGTISAISSILMATPNVTIQSYLTLGGVSRNSWPYTNCKISSLDGSSNSETLYCPLGYKLISGGCEIYKTTCSDCGKEDLTASYPVSNGWSCHASSSGRMVRVYTYCCV